MSAIVDRIKKLLALGKANSGATENEAANAMTMAAALMAKHNLDVQLDEDGDVPGAIHGAMFDTETEGYHLECGAAASFLYSCRNVVARRAGRMAFVGRADNIAACEASFRFFVEEVERLYKMNLPKGLSKSDRADFRRSFKYACARRLAARAWAIMETLRNDDHKAIAATGSRALVIVESIDAQLAAADELLKDSKQLIVRQRTSGLGTALGRQAGDTVKLQEQL